MGRSAHADWFRPRVPQAGSSCSKRRTEPEQNLHSGLRSADEQSEMGSCSGQRQLIRAGYWTAQRFGRQCVATYFARQIPADGTRRKTATGKAGVSFLGDRFGARQVEGLVPL